MARTARAVVMLDDPAPDSPTLPAESPVAATQPEPALEPPPRSPERQRLADAIGARIATEQAIAELGAAVETARQADSDASTAYYAAERAFRRAQPGHQPDRAPQDEYGYQDWVREQSTPPLPIAEARAAMEAAKDEKDTARRALEFHQGKLDELTASVDIGDGTSRRPSKPWWRPTPLSPSCWPRPAVVSSPMPTFVASWTGWRTILPSGP